MAKITREEFAGMHRNNQLQFFKEDIEKSLGVNLPDVPAQGNFNVDSVLDSQYFFA